MRLEIRGLNQAIRELNEIGVDISDQIDAITQSNAQEIEANAKANAPVDKGFLRNQISTEKRGDALYGVVANAPYSAYMEFGTGGEVEVPDELREIAEQFRGNGVRTINIAPRPFLYPAFVRGRQQYLKDMENFIRRITRQYNE